MKKPDSRLVENSPVVKWDDSHVRSSVPEVWNVAGTQEEVALLFGAMRRETGEAAVCEVRDRILMNPLVAKRLGIALDTCIRKYESDYGVLEADPGPDRLVGVPPPAGRGTAAFGIDYAEALVRMVRELGVEVGFERSFKLSRGTLLGNRFLLGIDKKGLEGRPNERVLGLCTGMNMPPEFIEEFSHRLPEANYIHFGFEENERSIVYKAYLEFHDRIEQGMRAGRLTPSSDRPLLHLGFKWEPSDPARRVVTSYTWEPFIPYQRAADNLSAFLDPHRSGPVLQVAKEILEIAAGRIPHQDLLYLEVAERGNPRRSFDMNVYRAGIRLGELYPLLLRMCRHYEIPLQGFHRLYEPAREEVFGHLAGGTDRGERDFLTVYYGVGALHPETSRSAPVRRGGSRRRSGTAGEGSFVEIEKRDEKASMLFRLVDELHVKTGVERSFKILQGTLLDDRFLLGFRRKGAGVGLDARILSICRRIGMDPDHLSIFENRLPESNIVLFGFEKNREERLCKAYLEFGHELNGAPEPFLAHMGFKWDAANPSRKTVAKYTSFPLLSVQDILGRVSDGFCRGRSKDLLQVVEGVLETASARARADGFLYFEVEEENNPRASFDINLYAANLRMSEIYPLALEMMNLFAIPEESFYRLYGRVGGRIFGHLTGGVDREGRGFLTVYHGEKGTTG